MRKALAGRCLARLLRGGARRRRPGCGLSPTKPAVRRPRATRCGARGNSWRDGLVRAGDGPGEGPGGRGRDRLEPGGPGRLRQYLAGRARRSAARKGLVNERVEEATRRLDEMRRRGRESDRRGCPLGPRTECAGAGPGRPGDPPGAVAVRPGRAAANGHVEVLDVPVRRCVENGLPPRPAPAVVALGRMKGESGRTSFDPPSRARTGSVPRCRRGGRADLRLGQPSAPQVDSVRESLSALKDRAAEAVPIAGGLRKQDGRTP